MAILTEGTILREQTDRGATRYWRVISVVGQMIWAQRCKKDGFPLSRQPKTWPLLTLSDLRSDASRFEIV